MEVVCLILSSMFAWSHAFGFWHPYIFHFYWKCFFMFPLFFFLLNGVNIFRRLQKYWCKLYIMKSYTHNCNEGQSFVFMHWLSFSVTYKWCIFSISLAALSAVLQEVVSVTVSTIQYSNAYHSIQYYYTMALILIIIIFIIIRMYLLTTTEAVDTIIPFRNHASIYIIVHNGGCVGIIVSTELKSSLFRVYKCACVIKFTWLEYT